MKKAVSDPARQLNPETMSELSRICAIPIAFPLDEREVEEFNRRNLKAEAYTTPLGACKVCTKATRKECKICLGRGVIYFRLYESQCRSVLYYDRYQGVFAPISCGGGKTGSSLMIAERAWRRGIKKSVLLIPPEVYLQLTSTINGRPSDISTWRKYVELTVPFTGMGGLNGPGARARKAELRKTGCFILPHSLMSTQDSSELLEAIDPDLIIIDEAHKFKNRNAARTKRLLAFIAKKTPHIVILSGSITAKSIKDYFHFLRPTLDRRSPLPINVHEMLDWSMAMDTGAEPTDQQKKRLIGLVQWARFHFKESPDPIDASKKAIDSLVYDTSGIRKSYRLRLSHCPGVVSTADSGVGTGLAFCNHDMPASGPGADKLAELITKVNDFETPNGDPIDHAIHKFKWLYELNAGFYYKLYWPTPETVSNRKNLTVVKATELLAESRKAHVAAGIYATALRHWFSDHAHKAGLDTPFLVGQEMFRNGHKAVGKELYTVWKQWKDITDPLGDDLIERDSEPVRIHDYKVKAAIEWAKGIQVENKKPTGCLVWYYNDEIGVWLTEYAKKLGLNPLHCPAGDNAEILSPNNAHRIIVASWRAHGTGKNLQHFEHQWITQWPRNSTDAEQLLARTHRPGIELLTDELIVNTHHASDFDHQTFAATIRDATYVWQSTGARQKVLIARYDPLPPMFPEESLNELGFTVKKLDRDGERILEEKFGVV